jgi:hypothetical protein
MYSKLMALGAVLAVAMGLGGNALAGSQNCPEARTACQPIGDRADAKKPKPRGEVIRLKATPKVDSSGQLWRAGNHIMQ